MTLYRSRVVLSWWSTVKESPIWPVWPGHHQVEGEYGNLQSGNITLIQKHLILIAVAFGPPPKSIYIGVCLWPEAAQYIVAVTGHSQSRSRTVSSLPVQGRLRSTPSSTVTTTMMNLKSLDFLWYSDTPFSRCWSLENKPPYAIGFP